MKYIGDGNNRDNMIAVVSLALVMEPLRTLTYYFLKHSRERVRPNAIPALCNLVSGDRSIVLHCLQYLSAVVRGSSPRMVLLFRVAGHDSFADFRNHCPEQAARFDRAALLVACWIHERHQRRFESYPMRLARLGDHRLSATAKTKEAEVLLCTPRCCLPWGMARQLQERVFADSSPTRLLTSGPFSRMIFRFECC